MTEWSAWPTESGEKGSEDPWCEGVLTRKYRDDDGMLRGEFRYFDGSPRLPEGPDLLDMERIDFA